jgi:hypothetical protein
VGTKKGCGAGYRPLSIIEKLGERLEDVWGSGHDVELDRYVCGRGTCREPDRVIEQHLAGACLDQQRRNPA